MACSLASHYRKTWHCEVQGVAEEESQLADTVMLHPLYPRLLEAVMACRKEASVAAAESQLAELTLLFQRADTANYDLGNHEEFSCKRSKGKLPDEAIEQLKQWWQQHSYWPYPTASDGSQARQPARPGHSHTWCKREDVKATLSCVTGLAPQQVSNWFVNQRKRYWHKLFPARQPQNAEEAEAMLRAHGLAVPDPSV
ncbi:uncharacterized protein HaLaN_01938 [Haematococcus lacustris]|uniref:Homeobox domain-containing protein n=1 Tax=Haematococcus lacustris TaxID=44745 RepID=A0A699YAH3_HAELA|nr:uncharacterized protein HaLaN_01938 [Haematococcus lacustris]